MKYIANILSDEQFSDTELYNIVKEEKDLVPGIPTLIIGWDRVKEMYPNASIIEWKISDNVFWSYGKYERRDKYEATIKNFQDLAFKKFIEKLDYVFYDILTSPDRFNPFLMSLLSETKKTIYITGDMFYIYYAGTKKVIGISLRDCDYLDETLKKKIFSAIYSSKTANVLKNNDEISREIRFKTRGRAYMLPYLYS